jgi:hypothetical protein
VKVTILQRDSQLDRVCASTFQDQVEEAGNDERFVRVANQFKVEAFFPPKVGEEAEDGVERAHQQDTNNVPLMPRGRVEETMLSDVPCRDDEG